MTKWRKLKSGNEVLGDNDDFYVSYRAKPLDSIYQRLGQKAGLPANGEETALFVKSLGLGGWLILQGDFRKEYEEAIDKGMEAVMAVYYKNKAKYRSRWSTDEEIT